ncbi:MAG: ABC transporter permease [Rhodobacteraceae bacterium]|nr:ABC transporter permease [Paracoccaceae bacterium]
MMQFIRFVSMRFILAVISLLLVTFILFTFMELGPFRSIRCADYIPLNDHYIIRWVNWVTGVFFRGDFGVSCVLGTKISILLGTKFLISLGLCLSALLLSYLVAIPVGIYSAIAKRPALNGFLRFFSYLGLAIPNFLFALIIIVTWAVFFGNTPTGLFSSEFRDAPWSFAKFVDFASKAWIPVIVLGWSSTAIALQTVRALISDEYSKLYVTAARARGLSEARLLWRYPARHAFGPLVNSLGFDLNRIFNELPIVALIFSLTDAGALLLQSLVRSNDQYLAASILFLLAASVIGLNFVTDVILAVFDPRFRRGLMG